MRINIDFVSYKDNGDTYNFGAVKNDKPLIAKILDSEVLTDGNLRKGLKVKTSFFNVEIYLDKSSELLQFKIDWNNRYRNRIWQARIAAKDKITKVYSEDMNTIIKRNFNPDYDIRKHLPKTKGIEVKTNTAPMQRYAGTENFGIITKGLTEYEVYKNYLAVTLLRSTGVISNPKNPSRSTPAGPPVEVNEAQQLGSNTAEFAIGFFNPKNYGNYVEEFYSDLINV